MFQKHPVLFALSSPRSCAVYNVLGTMQGTRPVVGHSPFIRELQPSPDTNRKKPQLQPSEPLVQGMNENRVNETESNSGVELSEKVSSGELGKGGVRVIASKEGLYSISV